MRTNFKKGSISVSFIITILFLIILGTIGFFAYKIFMPNSRQVPFYKHYDELNDNTLYIIMGDKRVELANNPIIKDSVVYIPVDFVKDYIDKYIFWDPAVQKLTITTEDKLIRMETDDLTYYINNKPTKLNLPVYDIDSIAYMPTDMLIDLYNISIVYNEELKLVIINDNNNSSTVAKIIKDTELRYTPSIKSDIAEKLSIDDEVYVFDEKVEKADKYELVSADFTKVRSSSGVIGYVNTKHIGDRTQIPPIEVPKEVYKKDLKINGKINLLWDLIENVGANRQESKLIVHEGVNVLSPTWFKFDLDNANGDLINIADKAYVDWAHKNGIQVWPLIADNDKSVGLDILSNTEYRENLIRQILAFISLYKLDGINIDFEKIVPESANYYLQFLRELSPLLKDSNVILSVDMYVPTFTDYYNRTEVAKVVDYLCVMTYDEHTNGDGAGPVASYDFVVDGIKETLKEVPADKVIMGFPFYSRLWRNDKIVGAYGMNRSREIFESKNIPFEWLEDLKLYYAEYITKEEGQDVKYQLWLEDDKSLAEKAQIIKQENLAGACSWVRSLQNEKLMKVLADSLAE